MDFVVRVATITQSEKLCVVYDSVGKDTFIKSLDCLRPKGLMVSFGQSSGSVGSVDLGIFASSHGRRSTPTRQNLQGKARRSSVVISGAVRIEVNQTYPLKEAARGSRDIEARKTTSSTVLTV